MITTLYGLHTPMQVSICEPERSISCKIICAPSEDQDQPAHQRSLIRVFAGHCVGS